MVNCNECSYINITEEQQQRFIHTPHVCIKYSVKLFHRSNKPKTFHQYITPCRKCNGEDFKHR